MFDKHTTTPLCQVEAKRALYCLHRRVLPRKMSRAFSKPATITSPLTSFQAGTPICAILLRLSRSTTATPRSMFSSKYNMRQRCLNGSTTETFIGCLSSMNPGGTNRTRVWQSRPSELRTLSIRCTRRLSKCKRPDLLSVASRRFRSRLALRGHRSMHSAARRSEPPSSRIQHPVIAPPRLSCREPP